MLNVVRKSFLMGRKVKTSTTAIERFRQRNENKCVICYENTPIWYCNPCTHIVYCDECCEYVCLKKIGSCPLCRKETLSIDRFN